MGKKKLQKKLKTSRMGDKSISKKKKKIKSILLRKRITTTTKNKTKRKFCNL